MAAKALRELQRRGAGRAVVGHEGMLHSCCFAVSLDTARLEDSSFCRQSESQILSNGSAGREGSCSLRRKGGVETASLVHNCSLRCVGRHVMVHPATAAWHSFRPPKFPAVRCLTTTNVTDLVSSAQTVHLPVTEISPLLQAAEPPETSVLCLVGSPRRLWRTIQTLPRRLWRTSL